jgi:hypothetical protein
MVKDMKYQKQLSRQSQTNHHVYLPVRHKADPKHCTQIDQAETFASFNWLPS